ncbi:MAG: carbohydrate-binding protein [Bacteroidales bacterium]|nr:carbohydrate-binding protein [Bacteroidales bacterium]
MDYTIDVVTGGTYDITFRLASPSDGGIVKALFGTSQGALINKTGDVTVPNTGDWQAYQNVTVTDVSLNAGTQIMRLAYGSSGYNINYISLTKTGTTTNISPTVSVTSPANGATYTAGANVTISASASDSDGSVTKVEFLSNGSLLGEDTSSPYSYTMNSVAAGTYAITARATDNDEATTISSAVNFTVNPATVTYTITASAGSNGSISPSGSVSVSGGGSLTFTIAPNSGYQVANVLVNGSSVGAVSSYTFSNVSANQTIAASFVEDVVDTSSDTLFAKDRDAANNITVPGTVVQLNGAGSWIVFYGIDIANYSEIISQVAVDGNNRRIEFRIGSPTGTIISTLNITSTGNWDTYTMQSSEIANNPGGVHDLYIVGFGGNPVCKLNRIILGGEAPVTSYTITASAGSNGSISPSGSVSVNEGGSQTFTVTPNIGYQVANVLVNGSSVGAVSSYTFSNVGANQTIAASFIEEAVYSSDTLFAKNRDAANNITVPGTVVQLNGAGSWIVFYDINIGNFSEIISQVAVDGNNRRIEFRIGSPTGTLISTLNITSTGNWDTYTMQSSEIVNNPGGVHDLYIVGFGGNPVCKLNRIILTGEGATPSFTITASAGANGAISPSGTITISEGESQLFTISANTGYQIDNIMVDGISQGAVNSYTFNNVMENHTIAASFKTVTVPTGYPVINSFSTASADGPATNLIDDNTAGASRWAANGFPQWIIVDYGAIVPMTGTRLWTYQSRAYKYKVELSADLDFTGDLVVDRLSNASTTQPIADDFAAVNARYAKITVTGASVYGGTWCSLTEFMVVVNGELKSAPSNVQPLADNVSIYPNPVTDGVLKIEGIATGATVSVYSITGVKLMDEQAGAGIMELSTNNFKKGMVIVSVKQNGKATWHKVLLN